MRDEGNLPYVILRPSLRRRRKLALHTIASLFRKTGGAMLLAWIAESSC